MLAIDVQFGTTYKHSTPPRTISKRNVQYRVTIDDKSTMRFFSPWIPLYCFLTFDLTSNGSSHIRKTSTPNILWWIRSSSGGTGHQMISDRRLRVATHWADDDPLPDALNLLNTEREVY
jgi:hypothetical protein